MYTSVLVSALLLASTAMAKPDGGYGGGGSYSSGGSGSSGSSGGDSNSGGDSSGSGGWSGWGSSSAVAPAAAAASAPPMAPPAGELLIQVVSVSDANGSLKYFPNSVQAPVGSIVQFQFHPKNHTVTESTFAQPCMPVAKVNASLITTTRPGLKSGFVPVTPTDVDTPVYNVLVNDTKPIWVYCGQTNHCQKGMAMVINQNLTSTDKTIEAYIAAAMALPLTMNSTSVAATSVAAPPPPSATSSTVVVAPPAGATGTTSAGLPAPTAAAASTTTGAGPATFTGAATRQRIEAKGVVAGLAAVGLAALL